MAEIEIWYEGDLSTRCVHKGTNEVIWTDGPKELQGKGEKFSPTDLLAASYGSCVLTLMGIAAKRLGVDLKGAKVVVSKEMSQTPPRRISRMTMHFSCPNTFDPKVIETLEHTGKSCPVKHSLHPDIVQELEFHWGS